MAMMRLPTRRSGGRANLHQGAIGVGVNLVTGITHHAVMRSTPVRENPDSGEEVIARKIPGFSRALEIAVAAADETGLVYLGADVVIDALAGPMILELNARPGLAIQLANGAGLRPRLETVDARLRRTLERLESGISVRLREKSGGALLGQQSVQHVVVQRAAGGVVSSLHAFLPKAAPLHDAP